MNSNIGTSRSLFPFIEEKMKAVVGIGIIGIGFFLLLDGQRGFSQQSLSKMSAPSSLSTLSTENRERPTTIKATEHVPEIQGVRAITADDSHEGEHKPHGAELLGVLPGKTTAEELKANPIWQKPGHREVATDFLVLTYQIDDLPEMPFIQIFLKKEIVHGIVIHLKEPRELADTRLSFEETIRHIRPIVIPDSDGVFREVYPEKGVAFVLDTDKETGKPTTHVSQIIVETVNPDYFIIRAEQELAISMTNALSDARHALLHDKNIAPGYGIQAKLELARGNFSLAKKHALAAVKLDNTNVQYQLTLLAILKETHQIEQARNLLRITEPLCKNSPWFRGEALTLEGELYRQESEPQYDLAIELHEKAINVLKPALNNSDQTIRILAKQNLIKAYLALALDLAEKNWEKPVDQELAFQSLNAAGLLADDLMKKENLDAIPLWEVCCGGLAIGVHCPQSPQIDSYIQTLDRLASLLIAEKSKPSPDNEQGDPFAVALIQYNTGCAYYDAQLIEEAREKYAVAIRMGEKALQLLETSKKYNPDQGRFLVGKILFHLGTSVLKEKGDSQEAMKWFEQAKVEFLAANKEMTPREMVEAGKIFVNMSHLYWKTEQRTIAIALTQKGTELLETALQENACNHSELFIPYINLATMYKALGNEAEAAKFSELAEEHQ